MFIFQIEWDIWHNENHWANESTALHYIDKVFYPTVKILNQKLDLTEDQKYLLIWGVFHTHHTDIGLQIY